MRTAARWSEQKCAHGIRARAHEVWALPLDRGHELVSEPDVLV